MKLTFHGASTHAPDYKRPYLPGVTYTLECECGCRKEYSLEHDYLARYMEPDDPRPIVRECWECGKVEEFTVVMRCVTTVEVLP